MIVAMSSHVARVYVFQFMVTLEVCQNEGSVAGDRGYGVAWR